MECIQERESVMCVITQQSYCHMLSSLGRLLGSLLSYVELIGPASGIIIPCSAGGRCFPF